jgi:hypothetical protein
LGRAYALFDSAKYAVASVVEHFNPQYVAVFQEWRCHLASLYFLNHAHFGQAAIAKATIGNGFAGTAVGIAVGHCP